MLKSEMRAKGIKQGFGNTQAAMLLRLEWNLIKEMCNKDLETAMDPNPKNALGWPLSCDAVLHGPIPNYYI